MIVTARDDYTFSEHTPASMLESAFVPKYLRAFEDDRKTNVFILLIFRGALIDSSELTLRTSLQIK